MPEKMQSRTVKNKDIPLIQEIPYLKQMITSLEQRRQWERSRTENINQHLSSTPGGGGTKRTLDDALAKMEDIAEDHGNLLKQYEKRLRKAERIINAIPSVQMRTFVTMMYLDQVRDTAVQEVLHMSRWSFENARNAVESAESMDDVKWSDKYVAG